MCSSFISVCYSLTKRKSGRKGFTQLIIPSQSLLLREVKAGTQRASHLISSQEQGNSMTLCCLLPFSFHPTHIVGTSLPRGQWCLQWAVFFYQLSRQSFTDMPTGQPNLDKYSTEAPFPVIPGCSKLTTEINHPTR